MNIIGGSTVAKLTSVSSGFIINIITATPTKGSYQITHYAYQVAA